ncbi:hypothetical protein DT603_08170 [Pseudoxanthomonas gei]|uniref:AAA+ ATPase domain-containing protein n=1 Tax=Pseudoxanthomonas gei TaxID=1383030 RepID=A0ABX0ADY4_9GAMM|nr:AAA family ATPase [Pseudoxanthomonas gei]NDK38812.1 hypothetical protein [Pseudoxanthomonas gei]
MNELELKRAVANAAGVELGEVTVKSRPGTQIKANGLWEGSCKPTAARTRVGLFLAQDRPDIAASGAVRRLTLALPFPEAVLVVAQPNSADQRADVVGYEDSLTAKALATSFGANIHLVPRPAFTRREWNAPPLGVEFLKESLKHAPNIVLQGPPGTGKSSIALELVRQLAESGGMTSAECRLGRIASEKGSMELLLADKDACNTPPVVWEFVQLHPGYSYDDLVRRVVPVSRDDGQIQLRVEDGLLPQMCQVAALREGPVILVLDEINRGNLAAILGEFVFAIDPGHRGTEVRLQYQGSGLSPTVAVPPNLWIIGTMNTADRSIALVDYAIRRRFRFIDVPASTEDLEAWYAGDSAKQQVALELFQQINSGIADRLKVGHAALFVAPSPDDEEWAAKVARRVAFEVFPILLEYEKEGLREQGTFTFRNLTLNMLNQREAAAKLRSEIRQALES